MVLLAFHCLRTLGRPDGLDRAAMDYSACCIVDQDKPQVAIEPMCSTGTQPYGQVSVLGRIVGAKADMADVNRLRAVAQRIECK